MRSNSQQGHPLYAGCALIVFHSGALLFMVLTGELAPHVSCAGSNRLISPACVYYCFQILPPPRSKKPLTDCEFGSFLAGLSAGERTLQGRGTCKAQLLARIQYAVLRRCSTPWGWARSWMLGESLTSLLSHAWAIAPAHDGLTHTFIVRTTGKVKRNAVA
jgi:hypothetical protein